MDNTRTKTSIAVDLRHNCIRIHRSCFRLLGEPRYIQLLVNPDNMGVAIRYLENAATKDSVHKINHNRAWPDKPYEIYSTSFVHKLCDVVGGLEEGFSYKINGQVFPEDRVEVFYLKTTQKVIH